jgi:hypothetical protein
MCNCLATIDKNSHWKEPKAQQHYGMTDKAAKDFDHVITPFEGGPMSSLYEETESGIKEVCEGYYTFPMKFQLKNRSEKVLQTITMNAKFCPFCGENLRDGQVADFQKRITETTHPTPQPPIINP